MIDFTLLSFFIPTFFLVSITPGMCMLLALTLGISIGVRNTLWMMLGEILGVALVAIAAVVGISAIMLDSPQIFNFLKILGAGYLLYLGINMWRSKGKLNITCEKNDISIDRISLFKQGLVTAVANPKGWAFMVSLLPPFINNQYALAPQLSVLVAIILISELICMLLYATGGKTLAKLLLKNNNVKFVNKISGSLMMIVGIWLLQS